LPPGATFLTTQAIRARGLPGAAGPARYPRRVLETPHSWMHRPVGPLAAAVQCIWCWGEPDVAERRERVLPAGTLDIVFNLRDDRLRVCDRDDAGRSDVLPGTLITGVQSRYLVVPAPPGAAILGIHFRPGGAAALLGIPAGDLEDAYAGLDSLWGAGARRLRERLAEASSRADRVHLVESFLLGRAAPRLAPHPRVALALEALDDPTVLRVADLRARTGLSAKQLIALFRDEVGIAPKTFWRIHRFQAAVRRLEGAPARGGAELAADLGYFDQAHLIRDFQAFAGLSPRAYLERRPHRPNHVPHGE
jgi:AraC-like DNA-binding protein